MKRPTAFFAVLLAAFCFQVIAADKPNIIFVLADDLGLDGVSCYGSDIRKTPNIDALAKTGTRFETCYAAPLCGPSRCLLMTGRYAFHTGGLGNGSWRADGSGAKSADEPSIAKFLKQNGYTTGQSGKWRQVGETPHDWGFDEYLTDQTAGGWFWQTKHEKNGKELNLPEGTYGPDVIQDFSLDFIKRHKDTPFFLYYAMHLVHAPIMHTPDSAESSAKAAGKKDGHFYDDNIQYMDKQVGALVAELERPGLREKTLIIFSGDNGTTGAASSTIGGRRINGSKASMLEGGSRVPFIASWPGVTPAGKVCKDIISFADALPTFAEVSGAKLPEEDVKIDGRSMAPQLHGEKGTPREWAYVQLENRWFVREQAFKMNEKAELFDMSDAPFVEKPVAPEADTEQSKAARARLTAVLAELNPAGGKTDGGGKENGGGKKKKKKKAQA
jgi:arylsulfatase A